MEDDSHALTIVEADRTPVAPLQWNDDDLDALKTTVAKDCNPAQFRVFMAACQRLQLDPFARQIVPIVQGGRMTPQVTIDGFRLIAERTHKYAGQIGPFWCGADGEWRDVWLADTNPVACKVGVLRRDFQQPMWGVARFKSFAKGGTWTTMPDVMIAKVAESIGLRKAFPQELGGAYTEEEMAQAALDVTPIAQAVPTDHQEQPRVLVPQVKPPVTQQTAKPAPKPIHERKTPPAEGSVRLLARQCGYESQDAYETMVRNVTHKPRNWTVADQWLVYDYLTSLKTTMAERAAEGADEPEAIAATA